MSFSSGQFLGPDVAGWQTIAVVAQPTRPEDPDEDGGRGADFGKSSPVGLLVLLLFFIAVAFLVRSMTKHLKRVPASFDKPEDASEESEPTDPPADSSTDPPADSPTDSPVDEKK